MRTRTWFHTGAFLEGPTVSKQYAARVLGGARAPCRRAPADREAMLLPDTVLADGALFGRDARGVPGARAAALLRTEMYADDGTARAEHPYSVTEQSYAVRRLQPQRAESPRACS